MLSKRRWCPHCEKILPNTTWYYHGNRSPRGSAIERFSDKYFVDEKTDCWMWTGSKRPSGYGTFSPTRDDPQCAHRWSYEHFVGPIPDGLEIDHLCRVPSCVNPAHLEPVTRRENARRAGLHHRKSACNNGHPFSPENTLRQSSGGRGCRHCMRAANRRSYEKRRGLQGKEVTPRLHKRAEAPVA